MRFSVISVAIEDWDWTSFKADMSLRYDLLPITPQVPITNIRGIPYAPTRGVLADAIIQNEFAARPQPGLVPQPTHSSSSLFTVFWDSSLGVYPLQRDKRADQYNVVIDSRRSLVNPFTMDVLERLQMSMQPLQPMQEYDPLTGTYFYEPLARVPFDCCASVRPSVETMLRQMRRDRDNDDNSDD